MSKAGMSSGMSGPEKTPESIGNVADALKQFRWLIHEVGSVPGLSCTYDTLTAAYGVIEAALASSQGQGDALEPGWRVVLRKARDAMSCPMGTRANFLMLEAVREIDALLSRDEAHPQPSGLREAVTPGDLEVARRCVCGTAEWIASEIATYRAAMAQADREAAK